MPTLHSIVASKTDTLDPEAVFRQYPWPAQKEMNCIVSTDSDGLLCGLLMSHCLNWKIQGFYDAKALVKNKDVPLSSCVFLDVEIFRPNVRSAGQHMLLFNKNDPPPNWDNFKECFSINNFRSYDGLHDFRLKYPFGTTHFLIVALHHLRPISIPKSAIYPILFIDGTYHNLFRYTENSRDWLRYLGVNEPRNPLHHIFAEEQYTIRSLMDGMNEFWRLRDEISAVPGERGDRVAITARGNSSDPKNLDEEKDSYRFNEEAKRRAETFIGLLSKATEWEYRPTHWCWSNWQVSRFTKSDLKRDGLRLNGSSFKNLTIKNPVSFAMTSGDNYEYTLGEIA